MATTLERKPKLISIQKKTLPPGVLAIHIGGLTLFGILIVVLTLGNLLPIFQAPDIPEDKVQLPAFDYSPWRGLVVQEKVRLKPFETAAQEVCREIHGRNKVLGQDPVAVVLSWMLEGNPKLLDRVSETWDDKAFILCEHHDVRKFVFTLQKNATIDRDKESKLTQEQIHGKFLTPNEVREFVQLFVQLKQTKRGKLVELTDHLPKGELPQLEHRLGLYEALRNPGLTEAQYNKSEVGVHDPFAIVALDKIPGSPWFSIGQLRLIKQDEDSWFIQMKDRVKDTPQNYLSQKHKDVLADFQKKLSAGQAKEAVQDLKLGMIQQREQEVEKYVALREEKKNDKAQEYLKKKVFEWLNFKDTKSKSLLETVGVLDKALKDPKYDVEETAQALKEFLAARDQARLGELDQQLAFKPGAYAPDRPEFRILHLTYLELRFPTLYQDVMNWQQPPMESIRKVLDRFDALSAAYNTKDAAKFAQASQEYFATLKEVSEAETGKVYPGEDTILIRLGHLVTGNNIEPPSPELIDLELTFNRVKPFMWSWVLMLGSLLLFCLSMGLNLRACYIGGFALYAVSLGFQFFGFFTRIVVSGRPPVTNMYETVIWVAFMTGIFALILEGIYRRKVIALAGAFVATLGLVLADQLPIALDPKITSLVPVLRSNFWLTIHVLTIVSSYAGGALAWALGNIALVLIVFGYSNRETIKMLSNFTYRALQIAVLLLAAGTFLGGWWAAYSWGRFWGWDPKETGALIALVCYVIPLHMRFVGMIKDFGLAVAGIVCFAAIMISWYGVNFIFPAGLHAYGQGAGGGGWVYWAACVNLEWVFVASLIYRFKLLQPAVNPVAIQPA